MPVQQQERRAAPAAANAERRLADVDSGELEAGEQAFHAHILCDKIGACPRRRMSRALVTGGASGIGAATVARLREDGMRVAAVDLDGAGLERVGADFVAVADVTSEEEIRRAVDESARALSGLDVCVACAGVAGRGSVTETTLDEWERVFAVNVRGVYLTAKAAIPHLRAAGGGALPAVRSAPRPHFA